MPREARCKPDKLTNISERWKTWHQSGRNAMPGLEHSDWPIGVAQGHLSDGRSVPTFPGIVPCLERSDWRREQMENTVGSTNASAPTQCIALCGRLSNEQWKPSITTTQHRGRFRTIRLWRRVPDKAHWLIHRASRSSAIFCTALEVTLPNERW